MPGAPTLFSRENSDMKTKRLQPRTRKNEINEMHELTINNRFVGPSHLGNGGYVAGLLARRLDNAAQVTLRRPTPLQRPLQRQRLVNGHIRLYDGETLIAQASPVHLSLSAPKPPPYTAVVAVQQAQAYGHDHPFPDCFVCGPNRTAGDGLCLRPIYLPEHGLAASTWLPDASLANGDGLVAPEFLWAALDCPGGIAAAHPHPRPILLGRLTARVQMGLRPGARCLVIGWPITRQGRKHIVGTALFDEHGALYGRARAIWIEP
jgi:hypothetical protein